MERVRLLRSMILASRCIMFQEICGLLSMSSSACCLCRMPIWTSVAAWRLALRFSPVMRPSSPKWLPALMVASQKSWPSALTSTTLRSPWIKNNRLSLGSPLRMTNWLRL